MKTKIIILTAFLASNVLAGGDDRDRGPLDPLDRVAPVSDQIVPGNRDAQGMSLTKGEKVIGHTNGGVAVTNSIHNTCKGELSLSVANVERFKAFFGGGLYNTGPLSSAGTEFSYGRWNNYFECVEKQ